MPIIQCRQLTRTYRRGVQEITALDHLELDVEAGEFLALMGPSGSGKTTLLNLVAAIDRPTSGELLIEGKDIAQLPRSSLGVWRRDHVGYIFQLYNLIPVLTAYENVELPLLLQRLSRAERHSRVSSVLNAVGVADRHDHYPHQLSGGQEQRIAIARAIVTEPKILVADEPTGDLDKPSARDILSLLQGLSREMRCTLIMVTHDPHAAEYASRTLHLEKGRLEEEAL